MMGCKVMEFCIVKNRDELMRYADGFCDLYKTAFKDPMNEKIFMQRYYDNPYDDVCMCLALDHGKVIANYSASPRRAIFKNKIIKCAQSLNTVTHPDYFGKGLFISLADLLYKNMSENGYQFVYGFPNHISNRTFNSKLGWKTIYEQPTLTLDLAEIKRDITFTDIEIIEEGFNSEIYTSLPKNNRFVIYKTPEYLNWRYINGNGKEYKSIRSALGSWAIFKRYNQILNIVELHSKNLSELEGIIGWIIRFALKHEISQITLWMPTNTEAHGWLEKIGFRNRYPIYTFGAKILNPSFPHDIFDSRLWSLQLGDENEY